MTLTTRLVPFAQATLLLVGATGAAAAQEPVRRSPKTPQAAIILPATMQPAAAGPIRYLSVDEAVEGALEQNLGIRIRRVDPQIQDLSIADARSVWTPNFSATLSRDNQTTPAASFLSGGEEEIVDTLFDNSLEFNQLLPWGGGNYTVNWDGSRSSTSNFFTSFDPILRSNMRLSFTQPLLRNFEIDAGRQRLLTATTLRDITDVSLRQAIVSTVRNVRNAYWDLVFAFSSLQVQRQSLELAEESLRNNRTRVEVGAMAPIDIVEAEAEVARNEEAVIVAEAQIDRAQDVLRTLILDPASPDFWNVTIEPTDTPLLQAQEIDVEAAIQVALEQRTDLQQLERNIDNTDVNIRYYRNQRMPDVNLQVNYALTGLGGTRLIRGDGFPGPVIGEEERPFGSVLGDIFTNDFPAWSVGVSVGYPLGTSTADANLARSELERSQAELRLRELQLFIAAEVRDVGRRVTMNLQRVEATRVARQLAELRLEAEQKKFGVGMSTSFIVFQAQRDLAQARNSEVFAILDYIRSLVDFEAVQEAPLSGGSSITMPATTAARAAAANPAVGGGQ